MKRFFILFLYVAAATAVHAQAFNLPSRPLVDSSLAPFFHGVASGDPLSDRVIIWTRVTTEDASVSVSWQVATDTLFTNVVNSGTFTTDTSRDHTVKVDVAGLSANTWYYYRFSAFSRFSAIGRTRTVPVGNVDSLRFAVIACSNFQAGFFNVYKDLATRNDLDAILHLGDYYYEYEGKGYGYIGDSARIHDTDHEATTLADYRMRHSQYKLDPDLRYCHQQYPFVTIWDDHETCNDSYHDGGQNHQPATEGDWFLRKDGSRKAYFEWMPIREAAVDNDSTIRRVERWGDLLDLIMIDTRYEGRDSTLGQFIPVNNAFLNDTARHLIGNDQLAWFKNELSTSTAKWRIIGNQVMVAPLRANLGNGNIVLNGDQWDGYPAERKRILDHIMQNNLKNIVFLTGDIHCSWGNDIPHPDSIYSKTTGRGSVATEMVCTSVTSPTFDGLDLVPLAIIQAFDPHVKYAELSKRGYLLLDINKARVQGDWIYMSTVTSKNYTATDAARWMNVDNERFLRQAPSTLGPRPGNPPLTPFITSIGEVSNNMIIIGLYPNPAQNEVAIQYYLSEPSKVDVSITDMNGKVVQTQSTPQTQYGLFNSKLFIDNLAAGTYVVSIASSGKIFSKQIVKAK